MKEIIIVLIQTLPPTLMALLAWRQVLKTKKAVQDVHVAVNSKMDKLLTVSKAVSHAEGLEEGRNENTT